MNCPSCQGPVGAGSERCPTCGAGVAPVVMGAAVPDASRLTPPSRGPAPLRDVPGMRKREKVQPAWKDEVRERMRQRKRKGGAPDADLPLFREEPAAPAPVHEAVPEPPLAAAIESEPPQAPLSDAASEFEADAPQALFEEPAAPAPVPELRMGAPRPRLPELTLKPLDLPAAPLRGPAPDDAWDAAPRDTAASDDDEPEWAEEDTPVLGAVESIERPAHFAERLQAGAVDAAILAGLYAVVLYFASRAAHTSVSGLVVAWPWLAGYLAFLGLVYAAWFTGMRGQTPGKMLFGLLVLTQAGERPGWLPAVARAAAGAAGIALVGLGMLPLFFDPARRTLHDRLLRARVVKV